MSELEETLTVSLNISLVCRRKAKKENEFHAESCKYLVAEPGLDPRAADS